MNPLSSPYEGDEIPFLHPAPTKLVTTHQSVKHTVYADVYQLLVVLLTRYLVNTFYVYSFTLLTSVIVRVTM